MGVQIQNGDQLIARLKEMENNSRRNDNCTVHVSFRAPYAIYVHEAVGMKLKGLPRPSGIGNYWDPAGKARPKFLLSAALDVVGSGAYSRTIQERLRLGQNLSQAVMTAGLLIEAEAVERVPVEHGLLKLSAYTVLIEGDQAANALARTTTGQAAVSETSNIWSRIGKMLGL